MVPLEELAKRIAWAHWLTLNPDDQRARGVVQPWFGPWDVVGVDGIREVDHLWEEVGAQHRDAYRAAALATLPDWREDRRP